MNDVFNNPGGIIGAVVGVGLSLAAGIGLHLAGAHEKVVGYGAFFTFLFCAAAGNAVWFIATYYSGGRDERDNEDSMRRYNRRRRYRDEDE